MRNLLATGRAPERARPDEEQLLGRRGGRVVKIVQRDVDAHDKSLYPHAVTRQAQYDITLLAGLDLPHTNTERHHAVDARLREILQTHDLRYSVVYGVGDQRCASALAAIDQWTSPGSNHFGAGQTRWQWVCDKCSDAQCEHQLFTALLDQAPGKN